VTIGDFWGVWDIAPEMDDNKGTSVVLVQSNRGAKLFSQIEDQLVLKAVSLEDASQQNQAMLKSFPSSEGRQEALALIREGRIADCGKWLAPKKPSLAVRVKTRLKQMLHKIAEII
jgi:hypothetical protein